MPNKPKGRHSDQALFDLIYGDEAGKPAPPGPVKAEPKKEKPAANTSDPPVAEPKTTTLQPITVTNLTDLIKSALREHLPGSVLVAGEVSNFSVAGSGHVYFTLKDPQSQISCILWRSNAAKLKFKLRDGLAVVVRGSVDVYPPRGQYQLYAEHVSPHGLGDLELAFRQLKEQLEKQGLFDPDHKISIPPFPLTIAVVTSPTGAAVRDILRTLELRWPIGRVLLYPVQVQGSEAAPQIVQALRDLNDNAEKFKIDVILLARGGGSLEDLWAFNEEIVARAIYDSELPIVSGIGHEIDVTIADLVADVRAATPTAAAQTAVPVLDEVLADLTAQFLQLKKQVLQAVAIEKGNLRSLADRGMFRHPVVILGGFARQLDESARRLSMSAKKNAVFARNRAHHLEVQLERFRPATLVAQAESKTAQLRQKLRHAFESFLVRRRRLFDHEVAQLQQHGPANLLVRRGYDLAPLESALKTHLDGLVKTKVLSLDHLRARLSASDYRTVLRRGFSVARRAKDSKIITSVELVGPDEPIVTEVADGTFTSRVEQIEPGGGTNE